MAPEECRAVSLSAIPRFKPALIAFVGVWPKHRDLDNVLPALIALLATDIALPEKYVENALPEHSSRCLTERVEHCDTSLFRILKQ
jgi:hypothetical protein